MSTLTKKIALFHTSAESSASSAASHDAVRQTMHLQRVQDMLLYRADLFWCLPTRRHLSKKERGCPFYEIMFCVSANRIAPFHKLHNIRPMKTRSIQTRQDLLSAKVRKASSRSSAEAKRQRQVSIAHLPAQRRLVMADRHISTRRREKKPSRTLRRPEIFHVDARRVTE